MAVLVPLAAQLFVTTVISTLVGKAASSLLKKRAREKPPGSAATSTDLLNVTPDPNGPLPGIFGHRRVGGRVLISQKSGVKTHIVIVLAGAPVTAIPAVYINNKVATIDGSGFVTNAPWNSSIKVRLYDGTQTTVDADLDAALSGWTADHVGKKIAFAAITLDPTVASSAYAAGIPDFTFDVIGHPCYDPRNGAHVLGTESTYTYSNNAIILAANYKIHVLGEALPTSAVDWASVSAAATICNEAVALKAGGTEPRYTASLAWNTDERHESVCDRIGAACAGGMFLVSGKYRARVGAWTAPLEDPITPADYGPDGLTIFDQPRADSRVNGVRGVFASPLHNFETRDFPAYQDATALSEDGGKADWLDIDLECVTSATQAQRLARIAYKRARLGADMTLETNARYLDVVDGDTIAVSDTAMGLTAATFRVASVEFNAASMHLKFSCDREDATTFAWTAATDEADFVAYDPLLTDAYDISAPGGAWYDRDAGGPISISVKAYASPSSGVDAYDVKEAATVRGTATPGAMTVNVNTGASGAGAVPVTTIVPKITATGVSGTAVAFSFPPGFTYSGGANLTEATTPYYILPAAATPILQSSNGGTAKIRVPLVDGLRATDVELFSHTSNASGSATSVSSAANTGTGAVFTVTGTPGTFKWYWAKAKNTADAKYGPFSRPLLVVF